MERERTRKQEKKEEDNCEDCVEAARGASELELAG